MRMTTEVQQLNAFNGQAQHQEMIRGGRFRGDVVGKLSFGTKWCPRGWPAPQGTPATAQGLPGQLDRRCINVVAELPHATAQSVLMTCFSQQPAKLNLGLVVQIADLATALIREEIHLVGASPASEHQSAHPRAVVWCHRGELQPSGCWRSTFAGKGTTQTLSPGWNVHGSLRPRFVGLSCEPSRSAWVTAIRSGLRYWSQSFE